MLAPYELQYSSSIADLSLSDKRGYARTKSNVRGHKLLRGKIALDNSSQNSPLNGLYVCVNDRRRVPASVDTVSYTQDVLLRA